MALHVPLLYIVVETKKKGEKNETAANDIDHENKKKETAGKTSHPSFRDIFLSFLLSSSVVVLRLFYRLPRMTRKFTSRHTVASFIMRGDVALIVRTVLNSHKTFIFVFRFLSNSVYNNKGGRKSVHYFSLLVVLAYSLGL